MTVGHILGSLNPADSLTKLYKNPIEAINSQLYRHGPKLYGSKEGLEQDLVATCQNGEFNFLGLPSKFLTENKENKDTCNFCHEDVSRCALARTRGQTKRESEEDASELEEREQEAREAREAKTDETSKGSPLLNWLGKLNERLALDPHSSNLLDPHYENKSDRVLSKETYLQWTGTFFSLPQLFRTCCNLAAWDLGRKK